GTHRDRRRDRRGHADALGTREAGGGAGRRNGVRSGAGRTGARRRAGTGDAVRRERGSGPVLVQSLTAGRHTETVGNSASLTVFPESSRTSRMAAPPSTMSANAFASSTK